jgi:spermidine/putrescine transport system permease protein
MKQFFGRALRPGYMTLIYFLFYLPIGILIVYSFNDATFSMLWHGFTFNWYQQLFQDTGIWRAAGHSVLIGLLASIIATFLGMLAAVSLYRYRFYGQNLLYGLVFILIITPDIVMGVSLLSLFSVTNVPLGFLSLLIAHITFCIPFVVVIIYSRITGLDKNIFEAAHDLGANEWTILRRVTIPLLLPALISACLLSFTLSFDDVLISYFVSGPAFEILPLKIYSMARLGIKPELNALCAIVFTITVLLVATAQLIMRKKQ